MFTGSGEDLNGYEVVEGDMLEIPSEVYYAHRYLPTSAPGSERLSAITKKLY